METIYSTCRFCDGGCAIKAGIDGDVLSISPANPEHPAICSKAHMVDEYRLHPDRVIHPLKNVGPRGEATWQEVSWDQALDEIAERLKRVIDRYGPEAVAFSEMPGNLGFGGITRRLMNRMGTPNYIAPVELCMGNTAQVHRATYGWYAFANWKVADCIVYFGQDRDAERWPSEYLNLKAALAQGATLIVVDPRETETAKLATYHLRIRYGTDAALALGWINTIISEDLYDHDFVEDSCVGFEALKARAAEYPVERVADICNIEPELIRKSARTYANAKAAIIPWGVVGDMQRNSTSVIRCQCILRAICGFIGKSETVIGPAVGGITNSELAAFDLLPQEKRDLQLGSDAHPLLTFRASALYREADARFGVPYEPDILGQSCACDPAALFAAMRGEGPYPVKAFFSVANNTVMSYSNQKGIIDGFLNQDLVVVFENWMTPTAQLADYVLPGDMWAERDTMGPAFDVAPAFTFDRAFREPVGECRNWYSVIKGLADRLGFAQEFPWKDVYELYDYRLAPLGTTWNEASEKGPVMNKPVAIGRFVTPSGKVELESSVLRTLGFDPLPYYEEPSDPGSIGGDFPYVIFAGYRERKSYNTCLHQMPKLRAAEPEPHLFMNPADADAENLSDGEWCIVSTAYGKVRLILTVDKAQPAGTLRVPHGWWKPETQQGLDGALSEANLYNDGMLFPDADWNLDPAQGVPNLRGGIHARVSKAC